MQQLPLLHITRLSSVNLQQRKQYDDAKDQWRWLQSEVEILNVVTKQDLTFLSEEQRMETPKSQQTITTNLLDKKKVKPQLYGRW